MTFKAVRLHEHESQRRYGKVILERFCGPDLEQEMLGRNARGPAIHTSGWLDS